MWMGGITILVSLGKEKEGKLLTASGLLLAKTDW